MSDNKGMQRVRAAFKEGLVLTGFGFLGILSFPVLILLYTCWLGVGLAALIYGVSFAVLGGWHYAAQSAASGLVFWGGIEVVRWLYRRRPASDSKLCL